MDDRSDKEILDAEVTVKITASQAMHVLLYFGGKGHDCDVVQEAYQAIVMGMGDSLSDDELTTLFNKTDETLAAIYEDIWPDEITELSQ